MGHNPTVENTVHMLTNSSDVIVILSCALAHLSIPIEKWSDFSSNSKMEQHKVVLMQIIQPR